MRHEVTHREAVAQLSSWWNSSAWVPEVREVAGPPRSGRTGVLRALSREFPETVVIDATGLTTEELCDAVSDRSQGGEEFARVLVLLLNVHRAGHTRRSSHPRRIIESRLDELAESNRLGIVVEINDEEDFLSEDRPRYVMNPPGIEGSPDTTSDYPPEIQALALAEGRTIPVSVWRVLAASVTSGTWGEAHLEEFASQHPALELASSGIVRFADESMADALRSTVTDEVATHAHREVMTWLLDAATQARDAATEATPVSVAVTNYTAIATAMHAVSAGEFTQLMGHGAALALLSQDALLDAASCLRQGTLVDTLASDAFYAHAYGVGPGEQGEWASWLHLFAASRGETDIAGEIAAASRHPLPWRSRWTHWRPPGSWQPHFIEPGPVTALAHVIWRERPVVLGWGEFQGAVRPIWMWDAATGELLAPPFNSVVPDDILASMAWPDGRDEELTFKSLAYDAACSYGEGPDQDWLPCALNVGDSLVLAGPGGVFAVSPTGSSTAAQLAPIRGTDSVWPYGEVTGPPPAQILTLEHDSLQRIFAPYAVRRIAVGDLPVELCDTTARRVLVGIGLPVAEVGGLEIALPDGGELLMTPWPSGAQPPEARGPFFLIGQWWGGAVVLDGATGMVLRAQAEDEPESWSPGMITASDLHSFVTMMQLRKLASHFMAMAARDPEQLDLRYQLEDGLAEIDKRGAESPVWMRGLLHDSVW
ncbi:hypothetical protein T261_5592 [Streptomyces lydicus]|nr:hypothetical protein T261_5592 [Streptomyces lydicus]